MEKVYSDNLVQIFHGDAVAAREMYPSATVVTDPPYNVGYHYDGYADKLSDEDYIAMLGRVCSVPSVVIHYAEDLFKLSWQLEEIPEKVASWVYPSNTPRQWRAIAWFGNKPDFTRAGQAYKNPKDKRVMKLIEQGRQAKLYDWWEVNQVKNVSAEKTEHPCQIPFEVMDRIIKITKPEFVLDPFCGSGTTLLACKANGVPCVGVDGVRKYADIAAQRVSSFMGSVG